MRTPLHARYGAAVSFIVAALLISVAYVARDAGLRAAVMGAAGLVVICLGGCALRVGATATDDELIVHNYRRTRRVPWREIARVEIRHMDYSRNSQSFVALQLEDGKSLRIDATVGLFEESRSTQDSRDSIERELRTRGRAKN